MTIQEILDETKQYIAVKEASFQGGFKRAQAVEGIDSMPGSEHDSKVPSEYEKPDPEVDDGTQGPEGAFSNIEGAGNDADPTMKHVLEVDETAETPDEEPLITDNADAEPKTASALANKLLDSIKSFQTQKRAEVTKQAEAQKKVEAEKKAAAPKAEAPKAEAKPAPAQSKRASSQKLNLVLDDKMLDKLASVKQKIAEKKAEAVKQAEAEKQAEQKGAEDALRDVLNSAYEQGAKDAIEKLAQMAMDPAAMAAPEAGAQDAMAAMAAPAPAAAPAEAAPAAGGDAVEAPAGSEGDEVTIEEVVEALNDAVENQEIDPGTAEQLLAELAGAADAPTEEAPAETPAGEGAKEAAAKFASAVQEAHDEIVAQNDEQTKFAQAIDEAAAEIDGASDDAPTQEEVEQAVAELVDEGEIDPEAGAAILEQLGIASEEDKEAAAKFASAIKEASDECAAALAAEAGKDEDKGAEGGEEIDPEELISGIAELVESGDLSPEDAEDALHALFGGED